MCFPGGHSGLVVRTESGSESRPKVSGMAPGLNLFRLTWIRLLGGTPPVLHRSPGIYSTGEGGPTRPPIPLTSPSSISLLLLPSSTCPIPEVARDHSGEVEGKAIGEETVPKGVRTVGLVSPSRAGGPYPSEGGRVGSRCLYTWTFPILPSAIEVEGVGLVS